jgi:hypothetical protein
MASVLVAVFCPLILSANQYLIPVSLYAQVLSCNVISTVLILNQQIIKKVYCLVRDMICVPFILYVNGVVSRLRQLVAGVLPRRSGFDIKSIRARSVVEIGTVLSAATAALYSQYHSTAAQYSLIYQCHSNQWPRGLRCASVAYRLLGSWV